MNAEEMRLHAARCSVGAAVRTRDHLVALIEAAKNALSQLPEAAALTDDEDCIVAARSLPPGQVLDWPTAALREAERIINDEMLHFRGAFHAADHIAGNDSSDA